MPYCASAAGGRAVARGAVAERRGRAGEQGAGLAAAAEDLAEDRVLGVVHVGRVGVAAGRVLELVRRARLRDLQRHRAAVEGLAGALDGLDVLLAADHLAGLRVDVRRQPAGRAVGEAPAAEDLPGQARLGAGGVDDQGRLGGGAQVLDLRGGAGRRERRAAGHGVGHLRRGADGERLGQGLADALPAAARGGVDDEVAADDAEAVVAAVHAHVGGAVASTMVSVTTNFWPVVARAAPGWSWSAATAVAALPGDRTACPVALPACIPTTAVASTAAVARPEILRMLVPPLSCGGGQHLPAPYPCRNTMYWPHVCATQELAESSKPPRWSRARAGEPYRDPVT